MRRVHPAPIAMFRARPLAAQQKLCRYRVRKAFPKLLRMPQAEHAAENREKLFPQEETPNRNRRPPYPSERQQREETYEIAWAEDIASCAGGNVRGERNAGDGRRSADVGT